ncbi:MAG: glycosyltransferase family protein [Leptospirales bacterium]
MKQKLNRKCFLDFFIVSCTISFFWCYILRRTSWNSFGIPLEDYEEHYTGDILFVLARIKAYATGEILPFFPAHLSYLNAPFGANWSDYPTDLLGYYPAAILAFLFGLLHGSTLYVLLCAIMAGIAFYLTGRFMDYRRDYVIVFSILFGLSPYLFYRSLMHLTLTIYWHIPLMILAIVWCANPDKVYIDKRFALTFFFVVAFLTGMYNPYYACCFVWLLCLVGIGQASDRQFVALKKSIFLFSAAVLGFIATHLDTFLFVAINGVNHGGVVRGIDSLYGLRLPDMFFPYTHRSHLMMTISRFYQNRAPGGINRGEAALAYIGIISVFGFLWLSISGTIKVFAKKCEEVSFWYWILLSILALGIGGGVIYLFEAFGFQLIRATNRFSIVIMAIVLLFLSEKLPQTRFGKIWFLLPIVIIIVGLWDQLPPRVTPQVLSRIQFKVDSDKKMVRDLERQLPQKAMVFELPQSDFPEVGTIYKMGDYDHFRPYLFSHFLSFSYGTVKGREDGQWQEIVGKLPPHEMLQYLNKYGFSALLINKKGYEDGANKLSREVRSEGYEIIYNKGDFVAFRLRPVSDPSLPNLGQIERTLNMNQFEDLLKATKCYLREKVRSTHLTPLAAEKIGCLDLNYGGYQPDAPNSNWTQFGGWAGAWGDKSVAIGMLGSYETIQNIIKKYGPISKNIYFPYPMKLQQNKMLTPKIKGQLLIEFDQDYFMSGSLSK